MTVIAYSAKHRMLATDSRCSDDDGEFHLTPCRKVFRLKSGAILGSAGDADDRDFMKLMEKATPSRMPSRRALAALESDILAIVVFPNGRRFRVKCEFTERGEGKHGMWSGEVFEIEDPIIAIGTGASYAYGAMELGADPIKAVEVACKRDLKCALPVQAEKLR